MVSYQEKNTLLQIEDIHLVLGENNILDGVDLEIRDVVQANKVRGQIQCILGPSGIGKTMLLRTMAGLLEPTKGEVLIALDGQNLQPVVPGNIGIVWQDYPLFDHLTVGGNLILAGKVSGLSKAEAKDKAYALLERFGLIERRRFWPTQLSGGQRQRIAILQQVMVQSLFLMMDEPFSGLDPRALQHVIGLIRELSSSHEFQTFILVTHDIRAAIQVSEYLHILGKKYDGEGNVTRSAHFVESINLLDRGIAWEENIRELPGFQKMINEVEDKFSDL